MGSMESLHWSIRNYVKHASMALVDGMLQQTDVQVVEPDVIIELPAGSTTCNLVSESPLQALYMQQALLPSAQCSTKA